MKKTCMAISGVLASAVSPLCADGFSKSDRDLIANKDVLPEE